MTYTAQSEDFWSLIPEWDRLASGSPQGVFATSAWHRLWCDAYAGERDLHFFSVRDGGTLVAVAPLMWEGDCIYRIGSDDVWDYQDLIVGPGVDVAAALAAILEVIDAWPWQRIVLPAVPEDSLTRIALEQLSSSAYSYTEELVYVTPKATLPSDWESYLGQLSKKDRHELRRKLRRLEDAGGSEFESLAGSEATDSDMGDFFRLHRLSRSEKALFMTDERAGFFTSVLREPYPSGPALLFFLRFRGERVAAAVCFDTGDAYLLFNSGYDPAFASYSVGLLLKALCIKHAIGAGRRTFNFLRGSEPYKYDLGGRDEGLYCVSLERRGE